jgi:glucose/arabinose dehydrogenase
VGFHRETAQARRPADIALTPDGALFVVDDTDGTIWRVTYAKNEAAQAKKQ